MEALRPVKISLGIRNNNRAESFFSHLKSEIKLKGTSETLFCDVIRYLDQRLIDRRIKFRNQVVRSKSAENKNNRYEYLQKELTKYSYNLIMSTLEVIASNKEYFESLKFEFVIIEERKCIFCDWYKKFQLSCMHI